MTLNWVGTSGFWSGASEWSSGWAPTANDAVAIGLSADVIIAAGEDVTVGSLSLTGTLELTGGSITFSTLAPDALVIGPFGLVQGYGTVTGDVTLAGGTLNASGGLLTINGPVLDAGNLWVDGTASLWLRGHVDPNQTIGFSSASGTLILDEAAFTNGFMGSTILGLRRGNTIDLRDIAFNETTQVAIDGDDVYVTTFDVSGFHSERLHFAYGALSPFDVFVIESDGLGGTSLRLHGFLEVQVSATPAVYQSVSAGDPPRVAIDPGLIVIDPDSLTLAGAAVFFSGQYDPVSDVLSFFNDGQTMGDIEGYFDATYGYLDLVSVSGQATLAQWQSALRSVTYAHTGYQLYNSEIQIAFSAFDGAVRSDLSVQSVQLKAVGVSVTGDAADNLLTGFDGNDTLTELGGNDVLHPGLGADWLDGGDGRDTVDYSDAIGGVYVHLRDGFACETTEWGASYAIVSAAGPVTTDHLSSIENAIGSAFEDRLYGTAGDNLLRPGAGSDYVYGLGGRDTVDYSNAAGAIYVQLGDGYALEGLAGSNWVTFTETGGATTDYLSGIANVYGSAFSDRLYGSAGDNLLRPGAGPTTSTASAATIRSIMRPRLEPSTCI